MIRILIADDHAIVRQGVRQVLALAGDMEVVAEARDGWEVVESLRRGGIDLLITDMSMPGPHGVDLVKRVKDEHPRLPVLVLSMHGEAQITARVLKAGATGYLTKDSEPEVLIAAARKVATGGRHIDLALAEKLVFETSLAGDRLPHELLSNREYEVLVRIARGESLNDIAEVLHVSAKTISTHKARLMQKLNVHSNAELVRYALQHGLEV
ncbi:response regulator transcription factor [Pseudothauera nasutitermitis]|uniref:Response regulator transcription factor n=1 Tax=Pseudothauera nasutitermitis TaxID=2565930 RepID=A0A4S4AQ58_9RHOO|nr:response regulator transcription factor [Pseudothauera nasutitermitis]THF61840.1 response regulator transcription factor [Pseudothauera nasutitermitis]